MADIPLLDKGAYVLLGNDDLLLGMLAEGIGGAAIRDYVATHLVWMASDTTGLPPRWAKKAGLEQTTYGTFTGTMFETNAKDETAFVKLFASQGKRKLGFRYGYRDVADHPHLVITAPKTP